MPGPWILRLTEPITGATRVVGGLPVALRIALDGQRAGAAKVVAPAELAELLADERLGIPVLTDAAPESTPVLSAPANLVLHREALRRVSPVLEAGESVALDLDMETIGGTYGFSPIAVTDDLSAATAERALLRSLRKPQDGWTARHLNRFISLAITRWLVRTPLSPNQVSVGILGVGLGGAWLATQGTYAAQLLGAALFQAQSVLDGCDGEMSRLTHRGSLLGEWLDTIGDDLTNYGFFAGAAWGLYQQTGWLPYLVAGAVTVTCGLLGSGIEYRYLLKIGSGDLLRHPASQTGEAGGALATIAPLFKRDTFVLLTLIAAALDQLGPMLLIFSGGAIGVLVNVLAAEAKMARSPS